MESSAGAVRHETWNNAKIVGQKAPSKLKDIWALCIRLQMEGTVRELGLFNLGTPASRSRLLRVGSKFWATTGREPACRWG